MPAPSPSRPPLSADLTEAEFLRWYWLKDELMSFAKGLDLRAGGSKDVLAARIAARLGGRQFVEPDPAPRANTAQLSGRLSAETLIPVGQRSSQVVRAWMLERIGATFHFDAAMRSFFAQSDGTKTMQDAVDHWYATRNTGVTHIDEQFEYNRFTRAWHTEHPGASRNELLAAWRKYRELPIDERGRA